MGPSLTILEKADLALRWPLVFLPRVLLHCIRCLLVAWRRGLPVKIYVAAGLLRSALISFSGRQMQFMCPTPAETYRAWVETRRAAAARDGDSAALDRLRVRIDELPDGASSILWVGNRERASRYVLFCPGGGYLAPMAAGHLEWCYRSYVEMAAGREVAVAVLQYTLCPGARHPTQLMQAAAALRHLLDSGVPAGHIVVGGDSAGGNLAALLLGYLARPDCPISLPEPLAGGFLVSPWVSGATSTRSFRENEYVDMLSAGHIRASFGEFIGDAGDRGGLDAGPGMPMDADHEWMAGWERATKALYVTVGAHEVLRDQGVMLAEGIRNRNEKVKVQLEIQETDAHDFILVEGIGLCGAGKGVNGALPPRMASQQAVISSYFDD